ncbi:glycosyltransferase family 4 protein [Thermodesulfobacteriota bacterium]
MKKKKGTKNPRFFYLVPYVGSKRLSTETYWQYLKRRLLWGNRQLPVGGIKIIYQHCYLLKKNGYEAYPVHTYNFKINWFSHNLSPISVKKALNLIQESDILVCPEVTPKEAKPFKCRRKIVFVQNWALTEATGPDKSYEDYGFYQLLSCSHYNKDFMKGRSTLPCSVVVNGIDLTVFRHLPERKKARTVLYLNRKKADDARQAIKALGPEIYKTARFIELESRYTQNEIVEYYQEADIFLALGYPEGFALPPLEAMACGCAVVGFTGGGGAEHMIDGQTALIAPDGDVQALSDCLKRILTNDTLKEKIRTGGLNKAKEFSIGRMERDLLAFVNSFH